MFFWRSAGPSANPGWLSDVQGGPGPAPTKRLGIAERRDRVPRRRGPGWLTSEPPPYNFCRETWPKSEARVGVMSTRVPAPGGQVTPPGEPAPRLIQPSRRCLGARTRGPWPGARMGRPKPASHQAGSRQRRLPGRDLHRRRWPTLPLWPTRPRPPAKSLRSAVPLPRLGGYAPTCGTPRWARSGAPAPSGWTGRRARRWPQYPRGPRL